MLPLSGWVFSAQDGVDRNYRYVQNHLKISFLNLFEKVLYVVFSSNGNEKTPSNIIFLSLREGDGGAEGHTQCSKTQELALVQRNMEFIFPFMSAETVINSWIFFFLFM